MIMTENLSTLESVEGKNQKLSRRDFLKLSIVGLAAMAGDRFLKKAEVRESDLLSRKIEGVEVFGTESKIDSQEKFDNIYSVIAADFEKKAPWYVGGETWEKRDAILGENVRALEVVVKQSDYDKETVNGGFVLYMKRHIDMLNRVLRRTFPKVSIEAKLARVIVVADGFAGHPAYKWINYEKKLASFVTSPDVDFSEFIGDEKGSGLTVSGEGATFWNVTDGGDDLIVTYGTGPDKFGGRVFTLPHDREDSLTGVKNIAIDYYYFHEWIHRLGQGVDDYLINMDHLDEVKFGFRKMRVENGNWAIPYISPYGAVVMNWMAKRGVRGYYEHPNTVGGGHYAGETEIYQEQPTSVKLKIAGARNIEVFSTKKVGGYDTSSEHPELDRQVDWDNVQTTSGESIDLNTTKLAKPTIYVQKNSMVRAVQQEKLETVRILPTIYFVRAEIDGQHKSLHFPVAILNMSKLGGNLDSANYTINITGNKVPDSDTLKIAYLDKNNVDDTISWINQTGGNIYATMDVDGTGVTCVWFQHDIKQPMNLRTRNLVIDSDRNKPDLSK